MVATPKWYVPVLILALLWNAFGCVAYLQDVMLTPEAVAQMSSDQQRLYESRPAWAVAGTAVAVWGGAFGCLGLLLRKRWSMPLLMASLAGLVVQDAALLGSGVPIPPAVYGLQGLVLAVAISLLFLARRAAARGWIT